ncbi:MAG: hypothetical protein QUV10_13265 [Paracoccaceae bacterium]|uniref:hypothetical protein n=1 Tax=unclassified Seohaeicola TaxID=2641111 RepID=UPI00237B01D7|nr:MULTISPECIES: hypothetical protein [unclassified Seohaeicola]MDD9707189.1 hypothetical protein [Seohaeicola sp. 4SK31]MDD9735430.1 hypothetical protein [Seohaeicola sp. SP36]MDF1708488.1 hypothetical protein [Paracoccaceae bacterium]MDM7970580.1 hypothetical protein [Paracoccaceae bacterium]
MKNATQRMGQHRMRNLTSALLVSTLILAGCGSVRESRFNPFNWFGRAQVEPVQTAEVNPLIPAGGGGIGLFRGRDVELPAGPLVAQVSNLTVERIAGGALIRATSVSDTVGAFNVTLEPVNDGLPVEGVLTYELRAYTAPAGTVPMPERARSHVAAVRVSDSDLAGVRSIRVVAARNAATVARR